MPEKFQFLEHTADLKFLAKGKTLEECFQNSAKAMFSGITDLNLVSTKIEKKVKVNASDLETLLHDFLSELLFLLETLGIIFKDFKVEISENKGYALSAVARGEKFKEEKHPLHTEIKAVTYHTLKVKKTKEGWKAVVLCDI